MELYFLVLGVLLVLWLLLNLLAPYSTLVKAERLTLGRLPMELLTDVQHRKVRFYLSDLTGGYGFSVWAPPLNLVLFDRKFFRHASPQLIRYVVAHEVAHFTLGHHRKRWFCVVTGVVLVPRVRCWLQRMENEADEVAEQRTGYSRKLFPELVHG